jgi:hypothetical protein
MAAARAAWAKWNEKKAVAKADAKAVRAAWAKWKADAKAREAKADEEAAAMGTRQLLALAAYEAAVCESCEARKSAVLWRASGSDGPAQREVFIRELVANEMEESAAVELSAATERAALTEEEVAGLVVEERAAERLALAAWKASHKYWVAYRLWCTMEVLADEVYIGETWYETWHPVYKLLEEWNDSQKDCAAAVEAAEAKWRAAVAAMNARDEVVAAVWEAVAWLALV